MTNLSKEEIQEYFQCDKSGWNKELSLEFWRTLRKEKIEKNDFYFTGFEFPIFPEYELSKEYKKFWLPSKEESIKSDVYFDYCYFNDKIEFKNLKFEKDFIVGNTAFKKRLTFWDCQFETLHIDHSYFLGGLETIGHKIGLNFKKELHISNSFFYHYLSLSDSNINEKFNIENNFINGTFHLSNIKFNSNNICTVKDIYKIDIDNIDPEVHLKLEFLTDELKYSNKDIFKYTDFRNKKDIPYKTIKKFLSEQNHYTEISKKLDNEMISQFKTLIYRDFKKLTPTIKLSDIQLPKNFSFIEIDFSNSKMRNSYFDKVVFNNCKWHTRNDRIVLKDEKGNEENYQITYRELKRNFENLKDWEFSGYSYVSEMEMRKKVLWKEKKFIHWFFYEFYYLFSGYTQNFLKPFYWFIFLTFIFFPLIYFTLEKNTLFDSLQISVSNSLPIIKSSLKTQLWWVKTIQVVISTTLLAFFILALRKRFKQ